MDRIYTDDEVFVRIKEKSRKVYIKSWQDFRDFNPNFSFEENPPGEDVIMDYFRHLRLVKKFASSSMWTYYSYINSVLNRKYGVKLQTLPRLTMFIQSFDDDTQHKAAIFDKVVLKKFLSEKMENSFWEVRQAIAIMAYFGGLSLVECMNLKLEQIMRSPEGYTITHTRDKRMRGEISTKFLVPDEGGYANQLSIYINKVNKQVDKFRGRVWFNGKKHSLLSRRRMGKNMVSKVPHEIADRLNLSNPTKYRFLSFRRTRAADAGSTTEQLIDFFGWKNGSMSQETDRLGGPGEAAKDIVNNVDDINTWQEVVVQIQHEEEYAVLAEDPEMYRMAATSATIEQESVIETTIMQAMSPVGISYLSPHSS